MSEQSALEDLKHGTKWFGSSKIITELLLFLTSLLLARIIAPAEWGYAAVVLGIAEVGIAILLSLTGPLVQRKNVTEEQIQEGYAGIIRFSLVLFVVVSIICAIFWAISGSYLSHIAWLSALSLPAIGFMSGPYIVSQRNRDFRVLSIYELCMFTSGVIWSLLWALLISKDAVALISGMVVGHYVAAVVLYKQQPLRPRKGTFLRDNHQFLRHNAVERTIYQLNRSTEFILAFFLIGATAAGILWRAKQVGYEYQNKVSDVINRMLLPVYAHYDTGDIAATMYLAVVRGVTAVVFPCLVIGGIIMPWLIPLVFGPNWDAAVLPATWFLAAGAVALIVNNNHQLLVAKGHPKPAAVSNIVLLVSVSVGCILTAHISLVAMAMASVLCYMVVVLYQLTLLVPSYTDVSRKQIRVVVGPMALVSSIVVMLSIGIAQLLPSVYSVPLSVLLVIFSYGWVCRTEYKNLWNYIRRKPAAVESEPLSSTP